MSIFEHWCDGFHDPWMTYFCCGGSDGKAGDPVLDLRSSGQSVESAVPQARDSSRHGQALRLSSRSSSGPASPLWCTLFRSPASWPQSCWASGWMARSRLFPVPSSSVLGSCGTERQSGQRGPRAVWWVAYRIAPAHAGDRRSEVSHSFSQGPERSRPLTARLARRGGREQAWPAARSIRSRDAQRDAPSSAGAIFATGP